MVEGSFFMAATVRLTAACRNRDDEAERWESGPYSTDFSLHIANIRVETVLALRRFHFRTPEPGWLLKSLFPVG